MMFKSGDRVYCIDDSRCDLLERGGKYQIANIYGSNAISLAGICAVYESWRFSASPPESATNAPDAAAELAKIAKLLDDCGFNPNPGGSTFTRFKTVLIQVAKLQSEQWGKAAVNLEAIK